MYMYTKCILYTKCMYTKCIIYTKCMYTKCIIYTKCMYTKCIIYTKCMYTKCQYIQNVYIDWYIYANYINVYTQSFFYLVAVYSYSSSRNWRLCICSSYMLFVSVDHVRRILVITFYMFIHFEFLNYLLNALGLLFPKLRLHQLE